MSSGVALFIGQMYVAQAILHLLDYPLLQQDDDVKAAQHRQRRLGLDISSMM
jgi:hypothetical protein